MLNDCLRGMRVLDLSQYIPGPFAALLLADLGAEVVKVEPPDGDPMRGFGPPDDDGIAVFYKAMNHGKTVVHLDLKQAEAKATLERLVARADVLVESYRPGTLARLGFAPDRLRALNPRLVHCALSGFGQDGPYRLRAGHDMTYAALAGVLGLNGPVEAPTMTFPPLADFGGALHAVIAILGALLRRGATGQGVSLDVSLFESVLHLGSLGLIEAVRHPAASGRALSILNGGAAYYRLYRCADGAFLAFAPIEPKFWAGFCAAVQRPDLLPRHAEPLPQTALAADLAALFATRSGQDWQALFAPIDCCIELVPEPAAVYADPHIQARGLAERGQAVRFPVYADGLPPPARAPYTTARAGEVVAAWEG